MKLTPAEYQQLKAKQPKRTTKPVKTAPVKQYTYTPLSEHQAITDMFVLFRGVYWRDSELTSVDRINEQLRKNNVPLRLTKI